MGCESKERGIAASKRRTCSHERCAANATPAQPRHTPTPSLRPSPSVPLPPHPTHLSRPLTLFLPLPPLSATRLFPSSQRHSPAAPPYATMSPAESRSRGYSVVGPSLPSRPSLLARPAPHRQTCLASSPPIMPYTRTRTHARTHTHTPPARPTPPNTPNYTHTPCAPVNAPPPTYPRRFCRARLPGRQNVQAARRGAGVRASVGGRHQGRGAGTKEEAGTGAAAAGDPPPDYVPCRHALEGRRRPYPG